MDLRYDGVEAMGVCCVEDSVLEQGADQSSTVIGVHRKGVDEQCIFDVDRTVERSGPVGDEPADEPVVVGGDVDVRITGPGCDFVGNIGSNKLLDVAGVPQPSVSAGKYSKGFGIAGRGGSEGVGHASSGAGFGGSTFRRWGDLEQLSDNASLGRGRHEPQA